MTMGLGTALFEAIDVADGQVANANLSDYNLPAAGDLPARFTHELIEREGAEAHGLGETVLPPVPAAIGNALGLARHRAARAADDAGARAGGDRPAMRMQLILNGERRGLTCEPTEMLLDVLEREGLTAARATCGIGVCGACTVLLDGEPVSGCITFAPQAGGPRGHDGRGARRQRPRAARVPRGARVPVRLVHARASCSPCARCCEEHPDPSDAEIAEALGGNLCRCGSYVKIADAVRIAARELREGAR